jgi:hypothetical protein
MSEENKETQEIGKAGNVDGEAPYKGSLDMRDAADALLIQPDAPEETQDKPSEDKVTEAAVTSSSTDEFTETEAVAEVVEETEEVEEETEEDDEESEATEATSQDTEEPEAESEEPETATPVFTTADGEDVTLDELKRGYLRQSDYTKKTQGVAEGRKALEQQFNQVHGYQDEVAKNLEMALNVIEPQLASFAQTDWETLASNDPYEYAEKRALFDQAQARYAQIQRATQETVANAKAHQEHAKQQMLGAEREKLQMALPDMADPKAGRKLASDIKEYALGIGLSEQEASNIVDHRLIVALNKARMYDQLGTSQISGGKKKVQKGPRKVLKGGQPQTKTQTKTAKAKTARNNLRNTGDVDSAVDWLLSG